MIFDQIGNVYSIVAVLIGLVICLFRYIDKPRRSWVYVTMFLLCMLLSCYYWGAYVLIIGDDPNVSSFLAYVGDNLSFFPLILLLLHIRADGEKRFFSILSLLPVPLTAYQFTIYIQFGGLFNNIWQCFLSTVVIVLSLNNIIYYLKNKKNGAKKPYVGFVLFFYTVFEYAMWTSSCYDWPNEWLDPYNYANLLLFASMITLPWAVIKMDGGKFFERTRTSTQRMGHIFKPLYIVFAVGICLSGCFIGMQFRDTIDSSITGDIDSTVYSIVHIELFTFSSILVAFSIAMIFIVNFAHKTLENARLKEEKIIAEKSNIAKSDFLASMSHEIRTPINAVLGMNEMILREGLRVRDKMPSDPDRLHETFVDICNYSGNIESAGNNLLSIINDILDFSKIEAGKMEVIDGDYKLSSVLNDVSNMIYFRAKAKNLKFIVDVDKSLPDGLYGDEIHVRQSVINILNNAVKYTEDGFVKLSVRGKKEIDSMNGYWINLVFEVSDTGIGIREEDMEKLFKRFERVDLEQNKTVEGTGLGLAITQNLLEMMGGKVSVMSKYGIGSTFTITIPQKIVSSEPVGDFKEKFEKEMARTKAYEDGFEAPDARILVVDDTKLNLSVVKGLLKYTKIMIDTAESGAESIEHAKDTPYDIIFMDQKMPKMDGSQALSLIREQGGVNKDTPVICLTADAVVGAREKYIAEGFSDYLTKPIDRNALEKMLIEYIPDEKVHMTA